MPDLLTGNLIDFVYASEARRIDEAVSAAKTAELVALTASLLPRPQYPPAP